MAEFHLKGPHVTCLYYIYKMKSLTSSELCDISLEDKAAISRSIDYLEKNGYLTCKYPFSKRYRAPLILTEKGMVTAEKIAKKVDAVLDSAGVGVSDDEREILYRSLTAISENLEKIENRQKG